jgi:hypothetical protein
MYRMQGRDGYSQDGQRQPQSRFQDEPKVIAISETRQQAPAAMIWALAAALAAYTWLSLLQLG